MATTIGVSALVLPATTAHAALSGCSDGYWFGSGAQSGYQGRCTTSTQPGLDKFRAVATCERVGHPGVYTTVYAPWVTSIPYPNSIAQCPGQYDVVSGYLDKVEF